MENRKILRFEKDVLRHIRTDIEAALKSVSEKYGVAFNIGFIKFSAIEFNAKLNCVITNTATGENADPDRVVFNQYCGSYGLLPLHFGARFTFGEDTYIICGIKPSSRKFPILAKTLSGRTYRFNISTIRDRLTAAQTDALQST